MKESFLEACFHRFHIENPRLFKNILWDDYQALRKLVRWAVYGAVHDLHDDLYLLGLDELKSKYSYLLV